MVDLSYFNDCFDDDTALKIKVIQLFIHQSDEKIASFHMQLQRKNYTEIAQIAIFYNHRLLLWDFLKLIC